MKDDIISLQKMQSNSSPTIAQVVSYYSSGDKSKPVKCRSAPILRAIANAANSKSMKGIEVLRDIMNVEEPDTAMSIASPSADKNFLDMRVFRNLMSP